MDKSKHPGREQFDKHIAATSYEGFVKETFETLAKKYDGKVFSKKKYVGKKSGHSHEIDVSVELELMELQIIVLIECKFYKRFVEISDLLEFAQRMEDIGAHKGVVVSTLGFQEGAKKVANANGIALVKTVPIWQTLMHSRNNKGESQAFYAGGFYLSENGSLNDRYVGPTIAPLFTKTRGTSYYFSDMFSDTIGFLVDPNGDLNFNEFYLNLPDFSEKIEQIEKNRKDENPESIAHLFNRIGVCKNCGCDFRYINYFKNWHCKPIKM